MQSFARELLKSIVLVALYTGTVLGTALFLTAPASAVIFTVEEFERNNPPLPESPSYLVFTAHPGHSLPAIRFLGDIDGVPGLPDNAAFKVIGENDHNVLVAHPGVRLSTLGLDRKPDHSLWMNFLHAFITDVEDDVDEVGPGWQPSTIGSQFSFPFLAFQFLGTNGISQYPLPSDGTVPEPATLALLGIGLLGLWGVRRGMK